MLRHDATTDTWVIFAPQRFARPHHFRPAPRDFAPAPDCPFCPGHEAETPPEIASVRDGDSWRVRVVPNRYPAVDSAGDSAFEPGREPFLTRPGIGAHEVVIETPEHDQASGELSIEHWTELLTVLRERERALERDERVQAVSIFKNHGAGSGASLPHPHWQILATPVVPAGLARRVEVSRRHFEKTGRSVQQDLLEAERSNGERILAENGHVVAYLPFASRTPYEMRVQPLRRVPSLSEIEDEALASLGEILREALRYLAQALADPAYNIVLVSAPRDPSAKEHFAFHAQILPRFVHPAGFEMGTDMWINSMPPEVAVANLRAGAGAS